jgi:hypothetical protein
MATISMKTMAAALVANAAGVGTALSLTTANATALANICTLLANRPGDLLPLLKLLSDTDRAQISSAQ